MLLMMFLLRSVVKFFQIDLGGLHRIVAHVLADDAIPETAKETTNNIW